MNKYDLSIIIPARNEMFVAPTVENLCKNIRGKTEVIVVLDGQWANPAIMDAPNVTVVYVPEALGQRGASNFAARMSKAKYIMKLDAHCMVDEGFDVKLMEDMKALEDSGEYPYYTMVPTLYNLHAFDWVCIGQSQRSGRPYEPVEWFADKPGCQVKNKKTGEMETYRIYQSPTPEKCEMCGGHMERQLIFKPRFNKRSFYYRFDKKLHFQYWGAYETRVRDAGQIVDIMSTQGSCFMLQREIYWKLNISDEVNYGKAGWGQQGVEVACKTWLGGGRLVTNKNTWYSHMFRTQGGDFGFPYPLSGSDQDKARSFSQDLWLNDKWPLAVHPFSWLIERFKPIPEWHDDPASNIIQPIVQKPGEPTRGIIFYTDNRASMRLATRVQKQIKKIGLPIVSASLKPMDKMGKNIHIKLERGYLTMFKQQLAALEASDSDIIYLCEHDVLYHPTHFDFIPPRKDTFYYNVNVWKINYATGHGVKVDVAQQVSGLIAYRELLIEEYKRRVNRLEREGKFERGWGFEPGTKSIKRGGFSDLTAVNFNSKYPNLDIRSTWNLTQSKWKPEDYRNQQNAIGWTESDDFEGWGATKFFDILESI